MQGTAEIETTSCTRSLQTWKNCQSDKRQTDTEGELLDQLILNWSHLCFKKYLHCWLAQGGGIFKDTLNCHLKPVHIQFLKDEAFSSAILK